MLILILEKNSHIDVLINLDSILKRSGYLIGV